MVRVRCALGVGIVPRCSSSGSAGKDLRGHASRPGGNEFVGRRERAGRLKWFPGVRTIFEWYQQVAHQNPGFAARRDENLLVVSACGGNVVPSQRTGNQNIPQRQFSARKNSPPTWTHGPCRWGVFAFLCVWTLTAVRALLATVLTLTATLAHGASFKMR